MKVQRGYKTELNPNKTQLVLLVKSVGAARFAYNWGLGKRINDYKETGKFSNAIKQHRQLTKLKKTEFPWMYEVSKCAPQEALRDLDKAYANFFRSAKNKDGKVGFPKFKSKHSAKQSFKLLGSIYVDAKRIKLPRIGWVKLKERGYVPKDCKIQSVTVSKRAGRWFVSVLIEEEIYPQHNIEGNIVGIDLGIKTLAVTSDNVVFLNPKALNKNLDKLAHLQRKYSRRKKGSNNRKKSVLKIQRLYYKVSCIRKNAIHQMTIAVVKTKPLIVVIEDLAVSNMLKNRHLARSVADACFGEIRRQLEYKAQWYGFEIIVADRFYPSSKLCSNCGHKKVDLKLSDRTYKCFVCGLVLDRDLNAAINLKKYTTASSVGSNACGDGVQLGSSVKQEFKKMQERAVA